MHALRAEAPRFGPASRTPASRSSAGNARQVISQSAKGVVASDRYGSSNWLAARQRQVCWAHLARDIQALVERGGESQKVGEALSKQVKRLFKLWHQTCSGDLSRERLAALMKPVRRKVKELLEAGTRCGQQQTRRTCANILRLSCRLLFYS